MRAQPARVWVAHTFLTTGLLLGAASAHAQTPAPDTWRAAQAVRVDAEARASAIAITDIARRLALPLRFADRGVLYELVGAEGGRPLFTRTLGEGEARAVAADRLWPLSDGDFTLTGAGVTVGVWDGGALRRTHQELLGQSRAADAASTVAAHSTHVAAIIAGRGADAGARGIAYGASIAAYDWSRDRIEMATAAAGGLRVSNHSYGQAWGWVANARGDGKWAWLGAADASADARFGQYGWMAAEWDAIAYRYPRYLMVKAAGNDRGEGAPAGQPYWTIDAALGQWVLTSTPRPPDGGAGGFDTILDAGNGKNVLTVGAVTDVAARDAAAINPLSNSVFGPTDDGRIKPDLVADGQDVYSATSAGDFAYARMSGTSMAAAAVTGAVALLLEHEANVRPNNPYRAATLRALLLHTADDAGAPGPDYTTGWGLVNAYRAADVMRGATGGSAIMREARLAPGADLRLPVVADGAGPLRITLAWTDPEGIADSTRALVNDLDLWLTDSLGTVYRPFVLNPARPADPATTGINTRDNAEAVLVPVPTAGAYVVHVRFTEQRNAPAIAAGTVQELSLVVTGARDAADALPVELTAFDARLDGPDALLSWTTASETNNAGFAVETRRADGTAWREIAFVAGRGTTTQPGRYEYRTAALAQGRHAFRLRQVDFDGAVRYSSVVEVVVRSTGAESAGRFALTAPAPNPFAYETALTLTLDVPQHVRAVVYDALGREVARPLDGILDAGTRHRFAFGGPSLAPGVYTLRLTGEGFAATRAVTKTR